MTILQMLCLTLAKENKQMAVCKMYLLQMQLPSEILRRLAATNFET